MFYVYQLRIESETLPFYIGKGKETRHLEHLKDNMLVKGNKHKINKIKKARNDGFEIMSEILHDNLSEVDAHNLEIELIAHFGRRDKGTGCLTNMTDGGEGMSGFVPSEEQCKRQSDLLNQPEYKQFYIEQTTRLWQDEGYKQRVMDGINRSWTDERRKALSERNKDILHRPEVRAKLSESNKKYWAENPEQLKARSEKFKATAATPEYRAGLIERNKVMMQNPETLAKIFKPFYISTRCYYQTEGWRLEYKKAIQVCCLEMKLLKMKRCGQNKLSDLIFGHQDEYRLFNAVMQSFSKIYGATGECFDPRTDEGYLEWRKTQDVEAARRIVFRDKYDLIMGMLQM